MFKSEQLRAARAFLGYSQRELASSLGLGRTTILNFENDDRLLSEARKSTRLAIESFFDDNGLIFIPGGIKKKENAVCA